MMKQNIDYDEIVEQGILYNFIPYDIPRLATYFYPSKKYDLKKGGWQDEEKSVLVIGEDEHCFITKLYPSERTEWDEKKILYKYIIPLGFNKSRFIRWEETQLVLF